ncbi:hypothetical protein MMC29_003910 [Sticta canariensis]|nr:hypothetical protein [Sticta canariensis]
MGAVTVGQAAQGGQKPSIVAIMGCTDLYESTFIKTIGAVFLETDATGPFVGDGLGSCTAEPKLFIVPGTNIILIDTLGFNDTHASDHKIAKKNLDMFRKVVGANNMSHCVLVTTKWSCEQEVKANSDEADLTNILSFWKEILDTGCKSARFEDTSHSAISIISPLCKGRSIVPNAFMRRRPDERAKKLTQEDVKEVREEMAKAIRTKDFETAKILEKERKELEGHLSKMETERDKLRVEYKDQQVALEENEGTLGEKARKHTKRGNRLGRSARRSTIVVFGAGAVTLTGGLAAPPVVGFAAAHEVHWREEKLRE